MTDDELITAYIDGQLSAQERAALETRAQGDATLRRRIAATQLISRQAQQLPAMAVPRNFILPRDMGAESAPAPEPRRGALLPTWLLRFGSLAAAGAFALVIAVELFQAPAAAPMAPAAAPMAAPADAITPIATALAVAADAKAAVATVASVPAVTALALPEADTRMLPAETNRAAAASAMTTSADDGSEASALTATPEPLAFEAASAPPADAQSQATAAPMPVPAPPPPSKPVLTPLRVFGLLALFAAIVLGALGWLRR